MSRPIMRTYETSQPWVIYTYGLTHDGWWPFWSSTRVLGYAKIEAWCTICGVREVFTCRMPRFGEIRDTGPHPLRTAFLARHVHRLRNTAPETWAAPLANPDAHPDTLDILRDVAERVASEPREPEVDRE